MENSRVVTALNLALEHEMSAMVRYLHHSFIVTGPNRGALVKFFRDRVNDAAIHAVSVGEKITALGGHPSVKITEIYEPGDQSISEMLQEDLDEEQAHIGLYEQLLSDVKDHIPLKAFLEKLIVEEQKHIDELEMYLREH